MDYLSTIEKYCSTSFEMGSDKTTTHAYGDVYNLLFKDLESRAKHILEIGIYTGFSLQIYSECFPSAVIYGIDIIDIVKPSIKSLPNVKLYFGDATHEQTINHFDVTYDLIIEDASHLPEHQIQHFADFCKLVKPGGYYVMEDLNEEYFYRVRDATAVIAKTNGLTQTVHDLRSVKGRFDDILLVFKKE